MTEDPLVQGLGDQLDQAFSQRPRIPYLKLAPGRPIPILVLRIPPLFYVEHYMMVNGMIRSFPCSKFTDPEGRCLGCYLALHDKGKQRNVIVYQVLDMQKVHIVPTASGGEQQVPCVSDPKYKVVCTYCQQGLPTYLAGKKVWKLGPGHAKVFLDQWARSRIQCKSCRGGAIRVERIWCPECQSELFTPDELRKQDPLRLARLTATKHVCPNCHQRVVFEEELSCSDCQNPQRASISDMILEVQTVKNKNYNSLLIESKGFVDKFPPEYEKLIREPIRGLEEYFQPPPINVQCALWKTPNPWAETKKFAEPYPEEALPEYPVAPPVAPTQDENNIPINFPDDKKIP